MSSTTVVVHLEDADLGDPRGTMHVQVAAVARGEESSPECERVPMRSCSECGGRVEFLPDASPGPLQLDG